MESPKLMKKKWELKGVEDSGTTLSKGCFYSEDREVIYKGMKCLSRDIVLKNAAEGSDVSTTVARNEYYYLHSFETYCSQMLEVRHPNILHFFGTWSSNGEKRPALVMELLPQRLDDVLERCGTLAEEMSYSILKEVAVALMYLHSLSPTPIVHGELMASNVYLTTDMTAKLADIGISSLLELNPLQRKPFGYNAVAHLPPEALNLSSNDRPPSRAAQDALNKKLDSYSYGVLMIHVLGATVPDYIAKRALGYCNTAVADNSQGGESNGVDELLGGVSTDHPLSSLIMQCIGHLPDCRPDLATVHSTISELMLQFPPSTVSRRLDIVQQQVKSPSSSPKKPEFLVRKDSIATMANSLEIEHLKLQIEELRVENRGLRTSLAKQREIVNARDQEMAAKLMAKDQEIVAKYQELSAQEAMVEMYRATIAAKEGTLSVITNQMKHLQEYIANKHEAHLLNPKAQLKWRKCAHLPQPMVFAQAITIGENVYFGSGTTTITESETVRYKIYRYSSGRNKWTPITNCPVIGFGMVSFEGHLTLVGGAYEGSSDSEMPYSLTGDVYMYDDGCSKCEKSLPSMPTARLLPTLVAYGSTIIACGGIVLDEKQDTSVSTVEIFSHLNSQWYCAEPLPFACTGMNCSIVQDHCYFLGGFTDTEFDHPTKSVFAVCLPKLVEDALVKKSSASSGTSENGLDQGGGKIWQQFPDAPRYASSLTTIGQCLVAIGGSDENLEHKSGALHVFSPLTASWLRLDDIPVSCFACSVARLPKGELLLIGGMGHDEEDALKTVFRGRISLE